MIRRTVIGKGILLFLIVLATALNASVSFAESFDTFNVIYFGSVPYISLVDLAERYRVKISYDPLLLKMTAERGESSLSLAHSSRFAVMNGSPRSITYPARLLRGSIFAPIPSFLPLFSELMPGTLAWDEKRRAVRVTGITTTIKKVAYEDYSNGTLICIALSEPLEYTLEQQNNWLTVNFTNGSFEPDTLFSDTVPGIISDTRFFQHEGGAQISFLMSDEVKDYDVPPSITPNEVLISLHKKSESIPITFSGPRVGSYPVEPDIDAQQWIIDTVVIDPGHGGRDSGAVGSNKTKEKDIVLKVAKELKTIIDESGKVKAVLTRDKDVFLPLHERARIARDARGKLFISLHANATRSRSVRGLEVFFLSAAKTKDAEDVARRENQSIEYEENLEHYAAYFNESNLPKDFIDIQLEMASSVYLKESQDMCSILLDTTCSSTNLQRRGVKQAGFYVMLGTQAFMPSVLFEIGFISNPEEEKLLNRASYQKRLAQAVYDAIISFKTRHEAGLFTGSR